VLSGAGDTIAFEEIYDRYWDTLYLHVLKMIGDEDESKDLLQDLFITLWQKSPDLKLNSSLSAYLLSSTRNRVFNLLEHGKIKKDYVTAITEFSVRSHYITDEYVREKELRLAIETAIDHLPEKMREIFVLSRKEFLSHKEIAAKLGVSELTVRKQVNNAIKILKKRLHLAFIPFFI
jgi:RNA polymerase sigma-70 factor (ECF subfamily)